VDSDPSRNGVYHLDGPEADEGFIDLKFTDQMEFKIPLKFNKIHSHLLIDEDFIDLGVITSANIYHEYKLYVTSHLRDPGVIQAINIECSNNDIEIKVATIFRYKVPIPFSDQKFVLLKLIAKANPKLTVATTNCTIKIDLDVFGKALKTEIPFRAAQYLNLLNYDRKQFLFDLKVENSLQELQKISQQAETDTHLSGSQADLSSNYDGMTNTTLQELQEVPIETLGNHTSVSMRTLGYFNSTFPFELTVSNLTLARSSETDFFWVQQVEGLHRLTPGRLTPGFETNLTIHPEEVTKHKFTHANSIVVMNLLDTFATFS
jgi:hypothetical protein